MSDFLIDVALLTDADNADPNDNDRVSLMTIHSAKGLEFPYVHIVGLGGGPVPEPDGRAEPCGPGGGTSPVLRGA